MKHSIITFVFLFSTFSFAIEKKVVFKSMTCETGTEQAIQDTNNGVYKYITYGLVASTDWDFDKFYWAYVKDEYNVIFGTGGCVVTPEIVCYTRKMKEIILQDFGDNFFEKSKKEARNLYSKS